MQRESEYQLIKKLIDEVKDECEQDIENSKSDKLVKEFYISSLLRYSHILQSEKALERIKNSVQSVDNFVQSLQNNFGEE
jgi:hypothetical protein|tara:strand:- start:356 stop:595 length:240 start_codon:yes stop_codon:yes gene_type:complete